MNSLVVRKAAPGRYQVWVADILFVFRTERDGQRFVNAASYALEVQS